MVRLFLALLSVVLLGHGSLPSPMDVGAAQASAELERRQSLEAQSGGESEYAVPAPPLAPAFRTLGQSPTRNIGGGSPTSLRASSAASPPVRRFGAFSSVHEDRSFTPGAHLFARPPPHHSEQS